MKGKLLKSEQGIAHSVFKAGGLGNASGEGETAQDEAGDPDAEGGEGGEAKVVKAQGNPDDILSTFKHLYIKEVVREPRIHFYRVPRLGCFMAVPLEYESCLSAKALESAVAEFQNAAKAREDQKKLKEDWEEEQ